MNCNLITWQIIKHFSWLFHQNNKKIYGIIRGNLEHVLFSKILHCQFIFQRKRTKPFEAICKLFQHKIQIEETFLVVLFVCVCCVFMLINCFSHVKVLSIMVFFVFFFLSDSKLLKYQMPDYFKYISLANKEAYIKYSFNQLWILFVIWYYF